MSTPSPAPDEGKLTYRGWRVVLACFVMATFAWTLGFYGHSVYLAELQRIHGWPLSLIATATTLFYLVGACMVVFISDVIRRIGPRRCLLGGIVCMAVAAMALGRITSPWQLYVVYALLSVGWASLTVAGISTTLGLWFTRRRGMAISLALNGASCGGIIGVPLLVLGISAFGFANAMLLAGILMLVVLVPVMLWSIGEPPQMLIQTGAQASGTDTALPSSSRIRAQAVRQIAFLSIAIAFALALFAQVGFVVHMMSFLDPLLSREQAALALSIMTSMAVAGRVLISGVIDRLNQRLTASLSFFSQAVALLLLINAGDAMTVYLASALFGFSVGNLITLPALIVQREFRPYSFGVLVSLITAITQITYSFGPGMIGWLRDISGSYTLPLGVCIICQLVAAGLIMVRGRPGEKPV